MRACLFGTYNRTHPANRIYAEALRAAGYDLLEVHEPLWEGTRDKGASYFRPLSLIRLGGRWLRAAWRLSRRWSTSGGAPVAVVGFNGQLDVFLLRLIAPRNGPRLIFAPLVSLTETLVYDRGVYARGSLGARLLAGLDRLTFRAADVVVIDTAAHRQFLIEELGADPSKVVVCHLGVDSAVFGGEADPGAGGSGAGSSGGSTSGHSSPAGTGCADPDGVETCGADAPCAETSGAETSAAATAAPLEILYFGQYLPLHGLDVVVDAVGRLARRRDLLFTFLGTGPERNRIEPLLRSTRGNVRFENWVPYEELPDRLRRADILLGVFGSSVKAKMVIPNKVYQAAAAGRAVLTADYPAISEVFEPGHEVEVCPPDGASLAAAIEDLAADPALREQLGRAAAAAVKARFGPAGLAREWAPVLAPVDGPRPVSSQVRAVAPAARDEDSVGMGASVPRVGVSILNWNRSDLTLRCLRNLREVDYADLHVLVVDNGSSPHELHMLERGCDQEGHDADMLLLDFNHGYAGANNAAMAELFEDGCEYVLLLNDDTITTPSCVRELVRCATEFPDSGPIGPRVAAEWPGGPAASVGERYWRSLLWAPRFLLRPRRRRQRSYEVGGVMGCAILIPRALYQRMGGFDESFFAYYEEVEYCLRCREAGFPARVEPMAEIAHCGHRGFGGGMTPIAAYLKARNLWRLGSMVEEPIGAATFRLGYLVLLGASSLGYLLRGRLDIVGPLLRGATDGWRQLCGAPPSDLIPTNRAAGQGMIPGGDGALGGQDLTARNPAAKDLAAQDSDNWPEAGGGLR